MTLRLPPRLPRCTNAQLATGLPGSSWWPSSRPAYQLVPQRATINDKGKRKVQRVGESVWGQIGLIPIRDTPNRAPHNYGPTAEDLAEQERIEQAAKAQREAEEKAAAAEAAAAEAAVRQQREKEMEVMLAELEKEEDEILKLRSLPLRKYLVDMVIPTLTQGCVHKQLHMKC